MNKVNKNYSHLIPMWSKKLIRLFGNIISNIIQMTKNLAIDNPHMIIGAFLGLIVSILLSHVPVLGWLIGPLATLFIILLGAYFGHCYMSINSKLASFFNIFVDYIYQIIVAILQHDCSDSNITIRKIGYSTG